MFGLSRARLLLLVTPVGSRWCLTLHAVVEFLLGTGDGLLVLDVDCCWATMVLDPCTFLDAWRINAEDSTPALDDVNTF